MHTTSVVCLLRPLWAFPKGAPLANESGGISGGHEAIASAAITLVVLVAVVVAAIVVVVVEAIHVVALALTSA